MKGLAQLLIVIMSFFLAGHATGRPISGSAHAEKIRIAAQLKTAQAGLSFTNPGATQGTDCLLEAEEDGSVEKLLPAFPALFTAIYYHYRLLQFGLLLEKKPVGLSELPTPKLPIYLLQHRLLIPFM